MNCRLHSRCLAAVGFALAIQVAVPGARADGHLDAGQVAALVAAPAALLWLGEGVHSARVEQPPRWTEPPAIDRWVAVHLAPSPRSARGNFMDSDQAAAIDVIATGAAVGWLDATYPEDVSGRDFLQGQLLFWSGYISLQGVQLGVKGAVGRERPLWRLAPEIAAQRLGDSAGYPRESFWSGHSSAAFYAATFLNLRLRDVMRRELSSAEYDSWSWVSPAVLYTWATWVAYSRIHAHQHYLTDLLVGAAVGTAFAALFASFDPHGADAGPQGGDPVPLVKFAVLF